MDPREVVLKLAREQLGYREKRSLADLDSPTANAGSANITKYGRDMDAVKDFYNGRKQRVAWCDVFYDWLFVTPFGAAIGRMMICQPPRSCGAGCRYSRDYYIKAGQFYLTPQPGDQVFFYPKIRINPKTIQHTGFVETFDGTTLTTIEGNTGNAVQRRSYKITDKRLAGFGRPRWELAAGQPVKAEPPAAATLPRLSYGDQGDDVKRMQQQLLKSGYALPKYGADGKFGRETQTAVANFQRSYGLIPDGIMATDEWQYLLKA